MEELELAVGRDEEQPVGLGDRARDLGEELRAGDADRDRQADPLEHLAPQTDRDLGRGARDSSEAADVEERLVDRQPFDQRGRVGEDLEHRLARFRVRLHARRHDDGARAEQARLAAAHRGVDAEGLRLVARGEHDPAADDHGLAPQPRIVALLDRCEERVEVGMQDRRGAGHEHMFAYRERHEHGR